MEIRTIHREDHSDPNTATLGVLECFNLPFEVKRIYWLSNFVKGVTRGNHSHKTLNQAMIMISGQMDLELYFGPDKTKFHLDANSNYVLVPAGHWRVMSNATSDAVLLVVADSEYSEKDYIRNWNEYQEWFAGRSHGS